MCNTTSLDYGRDSYLAVKVNHIQVLRWCILVVILVTTKSNGWRGNVRKATVGTGPEGNQKIKIE
jgi:hypothetical protein